MNKRLLIKLGSVCLGLVLVLIMVAACAAPAPTPTTEPPKELPAMQLKIAQKN